MKQRFSTRTRLVSALLTLAMVFTFLPFSAFAAGGTHAGSTIELSSSNFPDKVFREYLKKFDINHDNKLASAERNAVKEIDVRSKNISNLYGIQFFPNLKSLICSNNQLTSLDVHENTALEYLACTQNKLTSLDVRQNTKLTSLYCYRNQLTELDVSQNPALQTLCCYQNQLTSLNVSKNAELEVLWCYENPLTSLDVRQNTKLKVLGCRENQLTSLDVSQNTALEYLACRQNKLASLDVSQTAVTTLDASGNQIDINVEETPRTFDLSTLPGFNVNRASGWNGGTVNGNILTVNTGVTKVTYDYYCGKGRSETFTLNVKVVPDGTVTPPSGKGIRIYGENFPNYEFRQYLKANIDKNADGYLDDTELNIRKLDVSGQYIANLKGIEFFPNLETLYCYNNKLTSLDVSKNPELKELKCYNNKLTELDVRQNAQLETLYCDTNQLSSLDVSKNTALKNLTCHSNNLSSLDVTQNTGLEYLSCSRNPLGSLDVSKNINLKTLYCAQINLTSLDLSQNHKLEMLYAKKNRLTSLDLSQTAVTTLYADDNQITIKVEETPRTFDLSTLPGFDVTKATNWSGGTVSGKTLKVNEGATQVTYTYDCGKGFSRDFTLNVEVVPDGTVTPPSGGGTTIPPEAGKYQLTVTDGVATLNDGSTGHVLNVKPGDTVTLTADTTKFPENEEFGWWEITPYGSVSNTLTGQYQRTATFTMPNENVSARAMSKSAGVSTGGDDGGGGGGAAILLVGGAAVAGLVGYGVYSYVSEQQLKALLPEGVAMPENRAQTALLLWNTAGRPEPAEAPAFKDVADPDTAKAAQWCVEHGLMDQKLGGRFAPDNSDPAYKTLNAYQQLVG